jgi:hypothetical protein
MMQRVISLGAGVMLALGSAAHAQTGDTSLPGRAGRRPRAAAQAAKAAKAAAQGQIPNARQQALAKQVREAFAGVVKRQLSLTDDQSRRLQQVENRYQKDRNELNRDERQARLDLKAALEDSTASPDQAKVDDYLSRLVKAQRRRADILESEQKDLSAFLNPVQRAKYFALRDQLNRRINQLRQDGQGGRRGLKPQER